MRQSTTVVDVWRIGLVLLGFVGLSLAVEFGNDNETVLIGCGLGGIAAMVIGLHDWV